MGRERLFVFSSGLTLGIAGGDAGFYKNPSGQDQEEMLDS